MPGTSRRQFLKETFALAGGVSLGPRILPPSAGRGPSPAPPVAIARCRTYADAEVLAALSHCFDLIGGIATLVKGKTVTVKVNLTGHEFSPFMKHSTGETYMTHFATASQLTGLLFSAGARRVRIVESIGRRTPLEATLVDAGWDLTALGALGPMVYENTRNRGNAPAYAHLTVPHGLMFSSFELNRAYADTDVMISLAKLKQHETAGVTLSMKNMFGLTPNAMYGGSAGDRTHWADAAESTIPAGTWTWCSRVRVRTSRRRQRAYACHTRSSISARSAGGSRDSRRHHVGHAWRESLFGRAEMRFVTPGVLIAGTTRFP